MPLDLTIAIVNWNTREFLKGCLASIRENVKDIKYEVIVVDNASPDSSAGMVREYFPGVELLENRKNLGYAKANNQAFARARGRYFLLLNPDTVVLKDSVEKMVGFLDNNPGAAAVAPRFLNPDRTFQRFYRRFPGLLYFISQMTIFSWLMPAGAKQRLRRSYHYENTHDSFDAIRTVEQPAASCLLLRKDVFGDGKLFDERFPIFFNDVDLCKRIAMLGRKIYYLPDSEIVHFGGEGVKQLDATREMEYIIGWLRYIKKYGGMGRFIAAELGLFVSYVFLGIINVLAFIFFRKRFRSVMDNFSVRTRVVLCRSDFT
jgi:GT2 family glycosyltransferase